MTVTRRTVLAVGATLLAAPARAAEDSAAFVRRLYAGSAMPPLSVFAPALRAEMAKDARRDWNRVNFDWLRGGQELPKLSGLKVVILNTSGPDRAVVQASFVNWGEATARRFELVRIGGRWLIVDVFMSPEATRLTEVLATSGDEDGS